MEYDTESQSLLFDIAYEWEFEKEIELDFRDGIDIGIGTLEFAATADASADATIGLNFRVGVFLGEQAEGFEIIAEGEDSTPLAELNGDDGVRILVAVTAPGEGPMYGKPHEDVTLYAAGRRRRGQQRTQFHHRPGRPADCRTISTSAISWTISIASWPTPAWAVGSTPMPMSTGVMTGASAAARSPLSPSIRRLPGCA